MLFGKWRPSCIDLNELTEPASSLEHGYVIAQERFVLFGDKSLPELMMIDC